MAVKLKFSYFGLGAMLKSAEMHDGIKNIASNIGGSSYRISGRTGKNRVRVTIETTTSAQYRDNLKNNTLLKMLGGAANIK